MGEYFDLFMKRPSPKRRDEILQRISSRGASMALGRNFGENMEDFFKRKPEVANRHREMHRDREMLERWRF
jgi:hypothetical protein